MANRFENNILGFVSPTEWLDVGFQVNRPNDPIDGLFGDERTDNLVAAWQSIANEYQLPMMAQFHGFDTEAQKTFRVPVDNHNIEKGLIKVKINQSERMRALTRSGIREDALYDYVINDGIRLADQVVTRSKVAKNELMATGKVTIKENNLDLTVDYGVPENQLNLTIDFSDGADVPGQIRAIIDTAATNGVVLTGIMTSRAMMTKIRNHKSVKTAINGISETMVRNADLNDFMQTEFGISQVIVNDLSYGASAEIGMDDRPAVTAARYYPTDRMTFFAANPTGKLGVGLWGDPPELDIAAHADVAASGVSPYVFVTQWAEKDPAVLWTKASGLFMPVLYNPNSLWIATAQGE